jgi:hypothetical protein
MIPYAGPMRHRLRIWMLFEFTGRKWVLVVALVLLLGAALAIGMDLMPRNAINAWLQHDEAANGLRPN